MKPNVTFTDKIPILENEWPLEDGTQAGLLKNKHRYAELFRLQNNKYMV